MLTLVSQKPRSRLPLPSLLLDITTLRPVLGMNGYLIQYLDLARFALSREICLRPDCTFGFTPDRIDNLPMQSVDCLTDVELTACALLEPADQ